MLSRAIVAPLLAGLLLSAAVASPPRPPPPLDSEQEIRGLVKQLSHSEFRIRHSAARRLLRDDVEREAALGALARDLRHEAFEVRLAAARALPPADSDREVDRLAANVLLEALAHESSEVRARAVSTFVLHARVEQLERLHALLEDPAPVVRIAAVKALAATGEPEATLLPLLRDPSARVREDTAWALGRRGSPEARPALLAARNDSDPEVREAVAISLGRIGGEGVVEVLLTMLREDESSDGRAGAMWALGHRASEGDRIPPGVVAALGDPSHQVRRLAERALRETTDPEIIAALATALSIPDGPAAAMAAEILWWIGEPARSAVPALVEALGSGRRALAAQAAEALGDIGGPEAGRGLARALKEEAEGDLAPALCEALEDVGDHGSDAVPVLLGMLEGPHRLRALAALGGVGGDEALDTLLRTLRDSKDPETRQYALYGLRRLTPRRPEAFEVLREILRSDPDHENRDRAASAMVGTGGDAAIDALIAALGDSQAHIRDHVLNHLENLRATDRIPLETLTVLATDEHYRVSWAATKLLAKRDGEKADWAILGVFARNRSPDALMAIPTSGAVALAARPVILETAGDPAVSPGLRIEALEWLLAQDGTATRALLLAVLAEPPVTDAPSWRRKHVLRAKAATLLGHFGGEDGEIVAALEAALEDDSRRVRRSAATALGRIRVR